MTRRSLILSKISLVLALTAAPHRKNLQAQIPRSNIKDFTASVDGSGSALRSDVTTRILLHYNAATTCSAAGFPQLRIARDPNTSFTVDKDALVTEHQLPAGKSPGPFPFILLKKNHVDAYPVDAPRGSRGKRYVMRPHSTVAFDLETPERPCDADACGPQDCEPVDIVLIGPFQQVHQSPKADSLGNHGNDYRELSDDDLKAGNYLLLKHLDVQTCGAANVSAIYQP